MKPETRRVRYTKQVLKESLIELLKEQPINKVTVSAICQKADVNRSSFYLHFRDAYDLMEQVELDLTRQLEAALLDTSLNMLSHDMVIRIFQTIDDNRELCSVLLGLNGDRDFLGRVISAQKERTMKSWKHLVPAFDNEELDYLYNYITFGSVGVVEKWVLGGFSEEPEHIARMLSNIIARGLAAGAQSNHAREQTP